MTPQEKLKRARRNRTIAAAIRAKAIGIETEELNTPPDFADLISVNAAGDKFIDTADYLWECIYSKQEYPNNEFIAKPIFVRDHFESDYIDYKKRCRDYDKRMSIKKEPEPVIEIPQPVKEKVKADFDSMGQLGVFLKAMFPNGLYL